MYTSINERVHADIQAYTRLHTREYNNGSTWIRASIRTCIHTDTQSHAYTHTYTHNPSLHPHSLATAQRSQKLPLLTVKATPHHPTDSLIHARTQSAQGRIYRLIAE
eukprot:GHVU01136099.1.p3 GENE.GHVU01136099.1~~GHVU01136099.1.p3  ORF type:complete len:107 (+),score=5.31 GHVU01136099.1:172-492(+)